MNLFQALKSKSIEHTNECVNLKMIPFELQLRRHNFPGQPNGYLERLLAVL